MRYSFWVLPKLLVHAQYSRLSRAVQRETLLTLPRPFVNYFHRQGICNANYELIAWAMNCPGSQNDRTAFNGSGFENLLRQLPEAFYILGDAAYHASDRVLVPYPGTKLTVSQDSYNFYHSECRISVEETFGIMVRIHRAVVTARITINILSMLLKG